MLVASPFWAVAQVYGNLERKATENLRRQKFNAFYPYYLDKSGKQIKTIPLFRGYVFVEINPRQAWGCINCTSGVLRLLTAGRGEDVAVQKLPDNFITPLRKVLIHNPFEQHGIDVGMTVRIVNGPFAGENHVALVEMREQDRLKLLFSILGREVEIEVFERDVVVV